MGKRGNLKTCATECALMVPIYFPLQIMEAVMLFLTANPISI